MRAAYQDRPQCAGCPDTVAAADAVYAALCGHPGCPSVVFHGTCLMAHQERQDAAPQPRGTVVGFIIAPHRDGRS